MEFDEKFGVWFDPQSERKYDFVIKEYFGGDCLAIYGIFGNLIKAKAYAKELLESNTFPNYGVQIVCQF